MKPREAQAVERLYAVAQRAQAQAPEGEAAELRAVGDLLHKRGPKRGLAFATCVKFCCVYTFPCFYCDVTSRYYAIQHGSLANSTYSFRFA